MKTVRVGSTFWMARRDHGLPGQHRVGGLRRVSQLAGVGLVHDLVADHVGVLGVAVGDHADERGVVGLGARRFGRPEGGLGLGLAAPRVREAATGVVPGGHAAGAADGLARLARRLGEVGRPVELVEVDQHVDVGGAQCGDDAVELPERLRVPAVVAVLGRLGLDRVPADVHAGHVGAELLRDRCQVRQPDRHVEPAQDHGLAVLVDELPARRRHPGLHETGGLARADGRRGRRERAGADAAASRGVASAAPGRKDQGARERRERAGPHRPNARRRVTPEAPAAWSRSGTPRRRSVAPNRL